MNPIHLFLSFEGRIGRLQFWIGMIVVILAQMAIEWIFGIPLLNNSADQQLRIIAFVIGLIGLYPTAAIAAKRLRDRGQPGSLVWLLLVACAVALVGDLFGFFDAPEQMGIVGWVTAAFAGVIGFAFLIDLGFGRSIPTPKQHGPAR